MDIFAMMHSNAFGDPGGTLLHWIRATDYDAPFTVNQLTGGGKFPHEDCGEACIASTLHDRFNVSSVSLQTIEHDADNAGSAGTTEQQLVDALAHFGIAARASHFPPSPGTIMNPLGGRRIPPALFPKYAAAFVGRYVVIDSPVTWPSSPVPGSPPAPQGDRSEERR